MNTSKHVSAAQLAFDTKIAAALATVTDADRAIVSEMVSSGTAPVVRNVTPSIAALLISEHNGVNRDLSMPKVTTLAAAMNRGEWVEHHQGIAFYPDGTIADGQHRISSVVDSGITQNFLTSTDFDKAAIDAIDRSSRRSAGESLEMRGVDEGKAKATISKFVMNYLAEIRGEKPRYSDQQIEAFVMDNNSILDRTLKLGHDSTKNVSDPVMTVPVARQLSTLMVIGGWPLHHAAGFIASVQQGVATYPDAPTIQLAKALMKSNVSDRRKDRLNAKQKVALLLKGAVLWSDEMSVARLTWVATKEDLPTNAAPESALLDEVA